MTIKVTKSTGLIGALFIVLTIASFLGFWAYLLGKVQYDILELHQSYSLVNIMLLGAAAALVFNFCGLVGIKLIGARQFDQHYIELKPVKSMAFWKMYAVTLVFYEFLILIWHGQL